MKKPADNRHSQKLRTRKAILSASKKLFISEGYDQTTTRNIAENVDIAIGTIFAHFPEKHMILREILTTDIGVLLSQAATQIPSEEGAVKALLSYAQTLFTYYHTYPELSRLLLKETLFEEQSYRAQVSAFENELAQRLSYDAPALPDTDRLIVAQCLMANYLSTLARSLGGIDQPIEVWIEHLNKMCSLLILPYRDVS